MKGKFYRVSGLHADSGESVVLEFRDRRLFRRLARKAGQNRKLWGWFVPVTAIRIASPERRS